ncbi:hypothetical protein J6590_070141 [Homalodisca vitripennis]|nr:hypothetical protein J6590_070141 [Homalodisca vitripennis]
MYAIAGLLLVACTAAMAGPSPHPRPRPGPSAHPRPQPFAELIRETSGPSPKSQPISAKSGPFFEYIDDFLTLINL